MSGAPGLAPDPAAAADPAARQHARWLAAQARGVRAPLAVAAAAPLLGGALLVAQAWLLAWALDAAIAGRAARAELAPAIGAIAVLILVRAGLAWLGERAGARAAEAIKQRLRLALFDRLLARGPAWSRARVSGELASAIVDQVEALDGFFSRYLPAAVAAAVLPLAFAAVLLPLDVVAGLLLLVTAPLIPLFMALVGWGAEAASRRHLRAFARLSGFFADRLRGLSTLKLYGRAEAEARSVAAASDTVRRRTMAVLRIAFLSSAVLEFFAALGVAGMAVYFGLTYLGFLDLRGSPLTLQVGFFCLLMAPEAYAPLRQFAAHYHDRAAARAAVSQIAAAFDGLPDLAAPAAGARPTMQTPSSPSSPPPGTAATLRATALTVRAAGRAAPVLDAAELTLEAGAHVALMGPSGSGKTTLLETLSRLRPATGAIALDGVPLADWDEAALRARVALVGQRPYLYAGSIADNIRLGRPDASDELVRQAARRACVLEFARALPAGLDTVLGSRGLGLSGGQAQRVALARLFLREPGLILLDEPTAHLDAATQARVLDEILAYARGRTLLLATHAPAVARRLPGTLRLAQGKLEPA
ncbi:thiol reductant ABC exporter subunit CydD [Bordetella petrii]|nr:thiol reductant ABC exporter subunit CydD [Bordetella petrii]